MTDLTQSTPLGSLLSPGALLRRIDPPLGVAAALLLGLGIAVPDQAWKSLSFTLGALGSIAPWFALSMLAAAGAKATGADQLVAHAFVGRQSRMILLAALFGALSPFCSCGVIPLIAGLLSAGVPLAPVMAFWIASPLMDPNMFALTAAGIGFEFAAAKALAAIGMGLFAGFATLAAQRAGGVDAALRGSPSSCAAKAAQRLLVPPKPVWRFWQEGPRAQVFVTETAKNSWKLARWMTLAFLLESLMVAYVPGEAIATWLGGSGGLAIPLAVAVGVPAYLNGYAAIPLVAGLIDLGMHPAVGLAFMLGGGVTSIPAMLAVWSLVRPRIFSLYLGLGAVGALLSGYAFAAWLGLS